MTLTVTVDGGNFNANFYMLVPANTNGAGGVLTIANAYPDGKTQFQPSTNLSFQVVSAVGVDPSQIFRS